jgi:hypothetical protein
MGGNLQGCRFGQLYSRLKPRPRNSAFASLRVESFFVFVAIARQDGLQQLLLTIVEPAQWASSLEMKIPAKGGSVPLFGVVSCAFAWIWALGWSAIGLILFWRQISCSFG